VPQVTPRLCPATGPTTGPATRPTVRPTTIHWTYVLSTRRVRQCRWHWLQSPPVTGSASPNRRLAIGSGERLARYDRAARAAKRDCAQPWDGLGIVTASPQERRGTACGQLGENFPFNRHRRRAAPSGPR